MDLTISIGIIAAIVAGGACWAVHPLAKAHRWGYIPRYAAGAGFAVIAFGFVLATLPLPIETTAILVSLLVLIFGVEGFATWLAHDIDPDPPRGSTTPAADKLLREIDEELNR